MKRIKSALLLVLLCAFKSHASEKIKVGFEELPMLLSERNRHIAGAKSILDASEKLTGYLARSYLPTLDAHMGVESFKMGSSTQKSQPYGSVEARLNIFRGGRDLLNERVREAQFQGARATYEQVRLDELTKARKAYWDFVYQREVAELLQEALVQNESNHLAAKKRISAGIATEGDRIEFEMYREQLEQDLARMKLGAANAQRNLSVLLGKDASTVIESEIRIPHQHDDSLLTAVFEAATHREVRSTHAQFEAAQNQKSLARRWWTPQLDVYTSQSLYTLRERDHLSASERMEFAAGVRLSINLFDGLHSRAQAASFGLQALGFEHQAAQTARELSAQFEGAKQELALTHDLIHSAEKSIELGAQYLKRTQTEYARGVKNSPDVFSATQKYVDLKRRYIDIRRDYQLAKTELLAMLGR